MLMRRRLDVEAVLAQATVELVDVLPGRLTTRVRRESSFAESGVAIRSVRT
jgi:hypothetical protein